MDTTLIIALAFIAFSGLILGVIFMYCIKSVPSPLEQFNLMCDVTSLVVFFVEKQYPKEHPEHKKQLMRKLITRMLSERLRGPVTFDVLIDTCQSDAARMMLSDVPTEMTPVRQVSLNGARQRAQYRKK